MKYLIRNVLNISLCTIFTLAAFAAKAQVPQLNNIISKLEAHDNFEYQSVTKLRDMKIDTAVIYNKDLLIKAPLDKAVGYMFRLEEQYKTESFHRIDLYNGVDLMYLTPADTAFHFEKRMPLPTVVRNSLLHQLKTLAAAMEKKLNADFTTSDTLINKAPHAHISFLSYDTVVKNDHLYYRRHFYINKQTGLPTIVKIVGRYKMSESGVTEYYKETVYSDFKFDQANVNLASVSVPAGYHEPKPKAAPPALLAAGQVAPDWSLYATDGKKTSLADLKGKVVLMDYFFIGCAPCMASLPSLAKLHSDFKDVVFVSFSDKDSKADLADFKKRYKIDYPVYYGAAEVVKTYHITGGPTFYFVGKDGKIGEAIEGYNENFESKTAAIINKLLSK